MGLSDDAPGAAAGGGLDGPEGARWNAEWLRVTLASIGDGVLSTDAGGRVRFMNGVAERLTGWGLSEALGRPVDEVMRLVNAQTREVVENPAARALREGRVVALSSRSLLVSRGGAESPIDDSAAPIRAADGSVIGCVLVFRDVSERYRSEEALRASEAFSREVLESSPDRVMVLDTEGRMLRMNANGLRAMEIDDFGPYAGRSWLELWAPGCHQEVEAALATALSGNTARFQCLSPTKKGSKRWWDCVLAPMYGAGGAVSGLVAMTRDITDLKRAEEVISQSEARKTAMFDSAIDCIVSIDHRGMVTEFNPAAERTFGYRRDEVVGREMAELIIPPAYRTAHRRGLERYLASGEGPILNKRVELSGLRADGTEIPLELTVTRMPGDGPAQFTAYLRDISDRSAAAVAQERLAAIVESSDDAVISKSMDGVIASWNAGAQRMFGYTAEEALGKHISLLTPPERLPEEEGALARLQRGERMDHFETERVAKNGRRISVSLTVSSVRDATGRVVGASMVARDITERKRAEQERERLLASERAARADAERAGRVKDEFLATLSHELRTPLSAVLGWAGILRKKPADAATLEQGLAVIERNARLQAQLIGDLLDMSRIISGKMRLDVQRVELAVVIEAALDSVRPAAEAKEIGIQTVLEPIFEPVSGDPARLQQVVWNLVSNAVKFTPRGGRVTVRLRKVGQLVEIEVTDTGVGMTAEFLPRAFERFRQADSSAAREHGGLGLGLAIVKQLVELHGGSVRVSSGGEGKGAAFTVQLPLAVRSESEAAERDEAARRPVAQEVAGALRGVSVMILDDEPDSRDLARRLLEEAGATVMTAGSVDAALGLFDVERVDVVLSDIGLPGRDGYDFIRALRAKGGAGARVPAAALTAFARSEDRAKALQAGFQAHIAKPFEPRELVAAVAALARRG